MIDEFIPYRIHGKSQCPNAFIFFRPPKEGEKEHLSYNDEAWRTLSMTALPPSHGMDPQPNFSALCARWKNILDGRSEKAVPGGQKAPAVSFVDLYQSRRRRYAVLGLVLKEHSPGSGKPQSHYLFILERFSPEGVNFTLLCRQWKLNRREGELVRLLMADKGNKEIADALGLSLNTVKGYLKLLMRRLDVGTRAGIIGRLMTPRRPAPEDAAVPERRSTNQAAKH